MREFGDSGDLGKPIMNERVMRTGRKDENEKMAIGLSPPPDL